MKISLNENGTLIDAETKKSLNHVPTDSLPDVALNNAYDYPVSLSRAFDYTHAHKVLVERIERIERDLEFIGDKLFVEDLGEDLDRLRSSVEKKCLPGSKSAEKFFDKEPGKMYDVDISPMAAEYVKSSSLASEVLATNILTGVHENVQVNKEAVENFKETYDSFIEQIKKLHSEVDCKYREENPCEYDEYDIYREDLEDYYEDLEEEHSNYYGDWEEEDCDDEDLDDDEN